MQRMNLINTKAKAFVVFLFSLATLGILIFSTLASTMIFKQWYGILLGIALMISAIPLHCLGQTRRWGYFAGFLLNAVANGCSLSALYLSHNIELDLHSLILAVTPSTGLILLVFLLLQCLPKTKKATVTIACILNAILSIAYIIFWIKYGHSVFSFGFFASFISFFSLYVFAVTVNHDERSVFRDISFGSFGLFFIITFIVLLILSEGEILDGMDVPDFGNGRKPKRK